MNAPFDPKRLLNPFSPAPQMTLADVLKLIAASSLSEIRRRDLISALHTIAKMLGTELTHLPADVTYLRERVNTLNPTAIDFKPRPLSPKTWSNVRSNLFTALQVAGVRVLKTARLPRTPPWRELLKGKSRQYRNGLSRLAGFCSLNALKPSDVNNLVLEAFGDALRAGSFADANTVRRDIAPLWNRLVEASPEQRLASLTPTSFRRPPQRLSLDEFPTSLRKDVQAHLAWAALEDPFAADARSRPLADGSIRLRHQQILTAVTALVKSGTPLEQVTSLTCLVTVPAFKAIMSERLRKHNGKPNASEHRLAQALVSIAREWVGVPADELAELKRLFGRVPAPKAGLTSKNKTLLARLEEPRTLAALQALPAQLLSEAEREPLSERSFAKAQAGIAVCIGLYAALRPANIAALRLGDTLLLGSSDDRESVIELPPEIVKNGDPFGTVLAPEASVLLRRYCDRILRPRLGREPTFLFDNGENQPKLPATLTWLVQRHTRRRLGFEISLHQFRHIAAKVLLDAHPGGHESVRQLLGHKNIATTTNFYAGFKPARAARLHAQILRGICDESSTAPSRSKRNRQPAATHQPRRRT